MKKLQPKMQKMKLMQLIINKTYNLILLLVQKNLENTDENQENDEVQKENPLTNTRGEKYYLRPNPNRNFSDSYRY